MQLPAITQFKNSLVQKRDSWVEGGCDVIQSNNATTTRRNFFQGKRRQKTHDEESNMNLSSSAY